jgi:hypothetical protein
VKKDFESLKIVLEDLKVMNLRILDLKLAGTVWVE